MHFLSKFLKVFPVPKSMSQTNGKIFATEFKHLQTFATENFQIYRDPYLVCPYVRGQELPFLDFRDQKRRRDSGNGATGATKRIHFMTFATEVETL